MKYGKKIYLSIFWMVLGLVLVGCGMAGRIDDVWSTTGFTLAVIGGLQISRQMRYRTNEAYQEKVDIALEDERNKFLRNKAWAWAGYLFVIVAAVVSLVLRIAGEDDMADMAAMGVGLLVFLYWASYMVLSRKY